MLACCVGIVCRNMSYLNMSCHDLEYIHVPSAKQGPFCGSKDMSRHGGRDYLCKIPTVGTCRYVLQEQVSFRFWYVVTFLKGW